MARNYANISTAIWRREDDFTDLSVHAQWAYLMLVSQPDISAAGVLSINLRRWTGRASDSTRDLLVAALKELGEARYVVYDQETEELLVRTFVKWDGGYTNRKRQPVIRSAAKEIESATIRRALAAELAKLGFAVEGLTDSLSDTLFGSADSPSDGHSREEPKGYPAKPPSEPPGSTDDCEYPQENSLSDSVSASDRVVVTEVEQQTTTHNPQPANPPPSSGGAGGGARPKAQRADRGTRLPADWAPGESLLAWARERKIGEVKLSALVDIDTQTEKFINYWRAKTGKDATKLDWPATWRNWMLNAAERISSNGARASPQNGRSTGQNRHVDDLAPEEREARNPFASAVRSSQVATGRNS